MYLEHFGLGETPYRITPLTEFFFTGANRGEILDALIHSLDAAEGIIKVSGEVGSGKTMLCRILLERLPAHIEPIYLANPSLTREEMLYAIADALGLNVQNERVGIVMHNIQGKLEEKARAGKRVAVLVDEAHAMPLDTLEELRLLYNLQIGNAKLLQIVLFGQPELNAKLEQPNMRQLKDRIVHHFYMQPLSRNALESYLMFRMRAAGYRGPNIFSPHAVKLIAAASNGLMRRVNILADKSLLAAFVEDTHNIEPRHVQAAMRDSEFKTTRGSLRDKKWLVAGGGATAAFLIGACAWWLGDRTAADAPSADAPAAAPAADLLAQSAWTPPPGIALAPAPGTVRATNPQAAPDNPVAKSGFELYDRRMAASHRMLEQEKPVASIQLFHNEQQQPARIERFLKRADNLGKLSEIYLLPTGGSAGQKGIRVLYGSYPSIEAARAAIKDLPSRYQEAFTISIHTY